MTAPKQARLPRSFEIGGRSFTIEIDETPHSGCLGKAYSDLNKIVMFPRWVDGSPVPRETLMQTLEHEITHCIFDALGREDLSSDEPLVQAISLLRHQVTETIK